MPPSSGRKLCSACLVLILCDGARLPFGRSDLSESSMPHALAVVTTASDSGAGAAPGGLGVPTGVSGSLRHAGALLRAAVHHNRASCRLAMLVRYRGRHCSFMNTNAGCVCSNPRHACWQICRVTGRAQWVIVTLSFSPLFTFKPALAQRVHPCCMTLEDDT